MAVPNDERDTLTINNEWEKQIMDGVKAFQKRFAEELENAGIELPQEWLDAVKDSGQETSETPEEDNEDTLNPYEEVVRILDLAEEFAVNGDARVVEGLLAIADRYILLGDRGV